MLMGTRHGETAARCELGGSALPDVAGEGRAVKARRDAAFATLAVAIGWAAACSSNYSVDPAVDAELDASAQGGAAGAMAGAGGSSGTAGEGGGAGVGAGGGAGGSTGMGGASGSAGTAGASGTAGSAGMAGTSGTGGASAAGGMAGAAGSGGTAGAAASGGMAGAAGSDGGGGCDLSGTGKPTMPVTGSGNRTLTSDTIWQLTGTIFVNAGETMTIEPCTRIIADAPPTAGGLIVEKGGLLLANGTPDSPILFTSAGSQSAGAWAGVVILGEAPTNKGTDVQLGSLPSGSVYGGTNESDNSGVLRYVRIEYTGSALTGESSGLKGLLLAGVGSGTQVEGVMVREPDDDCFALLGGTADLSKLVCTEPGDDMLDVDEGYQGSIDEFFGRNTASQGKDNGHGLEIDGDDFGSPPNTIVDVDHVTVCGSGDGDVGGNHALLLRRNVRGTLTEVVGFGFDLGVDTQDDFGTLGSPHMTIDNSLLKNDVFDVGDPGESDDDNGFDETAWFTNELTNSTTVSPAQMDCYAAAGPSPMFRAERRGALAKDDWLQGQWLAW